MQYTKAQFRAIRERIGVTQKMLANHFGNDISTVKRWEKPGYFNPPEDVCEWLETMLEAHMQAVDTVMKTLDKTLEEAVESQGKPPTHINLFYYRSQEHFDRLGRDKGNYSVVNARTREVAVLLEARGIKVRFLYPEDDLTLLGQTRSGTPETK